MSKVLTVRSLDWLAIGAQGHETCQLCKGSGWADLTGPGGGLGTCPDCFGTGLPAGSLDCPQCLENPCKCSEIYGTPDDPPF